VTSWRTDPKTCASSPAARNPTPAHNWLCSNRSMGGASSSWPPTHPAGPRSSSKPATDHTPAWKTTFTPASKPASDTYPPPRSRSTEPGAWPRPSPATCCAGYGCSACMEHWPAPNRRPCATGSAAYRSPHRARPTQTHNPHPRNLALGKPTRYLPPRDIRAAPTNWMLINTNLPRPQHQPPDRGIRRSPNATVGPATRTAP
jgi:hypothetical protein